MTEHYGTPRIRRHYEELKTLKDVREQQAEMLAIKA